MSQAPDAFQLLGLPARFELDPGELDRRQRELSVERRGDGAAVLEALNEAVRALKDPLNRAELLFQRRGWSTRATAEPEMLERVFAEREQIEQWRRLHDTDALQRWLREVATPRQRELSAQLGELLETTALSPSQSAASEGTTQARSTSPAHRRALQLLEQLRYGARAISSARTASDECEE